MVKVLLPRQQTVIILGCAHTLGLFPANYSLVLSSNWASKASPTLGCSIEISRDIYMSVGRYVCRGPKSVGGITWAKRAHAQSQYWAVKSYQ